MIVFRHYLKFFGQIFSCFSVLLLGCGDSSSTDASISQAQAFTQEEAVLRAFNAQKLAAINGDWQSVYDFTAQSSKDRDQDIVDAAKFMDADSLREKPIQFQASVLLMRAEIPVEELLQMDAKDRTRFTIARQSPEQRALVSQIDIWKVEISGKVATLFVEVEGRKTEERITLVEQADNWVVSFEDSSDVAAMARIEQRIFNGEVSLEEVLSNLMRLCGYEGGMLDDLWVPAAEKNVN